MSVTVSDDPVIVPTAKSVALSQLFQITAAASDPAYIILSALDRNEYTVSASGATGTLIGNGVHRGLTTINSDGRETGIVFSYQAGTGRYYNSAVGYLDQLTYTTSSSVGDITDLSLFATSNLAFADANAADAFGLIVSDAAGYLGTATIATLPGFSGAVPAQATPQSIAAIADSYIGQAWNTNGCWTLASTIAAKAGASLPVQSTMYVAGQANGEWFVAYNAPAGTSGNWELMVRTGDMIGFVTSAGTGHITTCVSGSGSSAQLIDNITYVDQNGTITNPADDGSANDVVVEAPHAATQEWAGVNPSTVVIYRLDTPVVSTTTTTLSLHAGALQGLSGLFSAADPAGTAVTSYQLFNSNANDTIIVNGSSVTAQSAAAAISVTSLSSVTLQAGQAGGSDFISVRASNGAYWGDWTTLSLTSAAAATSVQFPTPTSVPTGTTAGSSTAPTPAATTATASISPDRVSVYRFFDVADGTHFFTASTTERDSLMATRSDLTFEGVGMEALATQATDMSAEAVYRFFDNSNGTHFFTADTTERDGLIASQPNLTFEGVAFYEDASPRPGDSAVYRFFDTAHGTHLYTESAAERATILASRPDLTAEGIAFYAPSPS